MRKRLSLYVSGLVQGVFFRASARQMAQKLGLVGFCSNLPDGRVEVVAEGEEETLAELYRWCQNGPPGARVVDIEVNWAEPVNTFTGFTIR